MKNQEFKDTIVITDGKEQPSTIEIPVRLVTKGLNQSINDFDLPAEALQRTRLLWQPPLPADWKLPS